MLQSQQFGGEILSGTVAEHIGELTKARICLLLRGQLLPDIQGGHFEMPLTRLRTLLKTGMIRFHKYGHIDSFCNTPERRAVIIDYDSRKQQKPFSIRAVNHTLRKIGIKYEYACYHRTRGGWHLYLYLAEDLERAEIIALQNLLGDDPVRGTFNLMRVISIRKNGIAPEWKQRHNIAYDYKISD